jgi:vacuolar-type H+-ATPase subunit E/Vma4
MDSLRLTQEEIKELHRKINSDTRIISLNKAISEIYRNTIPKGVIKENGLFVLIFDDKAEEIIKNIRSVITEIIENYHLPKQTKEERAKQIKDYLVKPLLECKDK